jgi:recombinational DNA repair ATPase RecF
LVLAEWEQLLGGPAPPLLLLDDVMSELDEGRRRRLIEVTSCGGQTVITATDVRYFAPEDIERATVVDLGAKENTVAKRRPDGD